MAGYYRYTAVLDACVLYPAPLRDLLISLAADGLYGARWTAEIQDEWIRNLHAKRPELDKLKLLHTASLMAKAIEDALIENHQYLIPTLDLPDPDDRHVLAAAIVGHADAIVTFNLKDFPEAKVSQHEIEILHPDDFLIAQYDLAPIRVLSVLKAIRTKLRKPPKSAEEYIATLEQQGLPQTSHILRNAIDLI
jgi:predicted nucleic acid-binding protein